MTARIDRFLQPGEHAVGDARHRLRTLLGSCVSITLWHAASRTGAMSHFLLPSRPPGPRRPLDGRYGDESLLLMKRALERRGIQAQDCEARVFGGGNMFPGLKGESLSGGVGRRNGEAAALMLQQCGITLLSEALFGIGHRQIEFDIASGEVRSRQLHPEETRPLPLHD